MCSKKNASYALTVNTCNNGENKSAIDSFMKSEGFNQNDYLIISQDDLLVIK